MSRTISPRGGSWFPSRSRCRQTPDSIWFRRRHARIRRNCTHSGNGWSLPPLFPPRSNPDPSAFLATEPKIYGWSPGAGMAHCPATPEHDPEKWVLVFRKDHAQTKPAGGDEFSQRPYRKLGGTVESPATSIGKSAGENQRSR